jgi:drug/metabolite transporter (DMT)-like permease
MQTTERRGVIAACTAVVMWGAGNVVVKYIPMSGLSVAFNRLWLGAVFFTALFMASGGRITWRALKVATPGGIAFGLDVAVFFSAIKHTSVADASVIGALQPALVFLAAGRLFGERIRPSTLVWTVIAIGAVIGSVLASSSAAGRTATGDLLSIGAVIAWSAYFVLSKRARQQLGAMEYQACMTIVGAIVLTPIALIGAHDLVIHTASNLGWMAIMVAVPGGGHLLMNWAHAHVPIVLTSLLTLAIPVVATLGALIFLGEGTTAVQLGCIAVVVLALVVVVRSGAPADLAAPTAA